MLARKSTDAERLPILRYDFEGVDRLFHAETSIETAGEVGAGIQLHPDQAAAVSPERRVPRTSSKYAATQQARPDAHHWFPDPVAAGARFFAG